MKTIYFLRSAPYDYQVEGLNLYQSFNAVITKEVQPPLLPGGKEYFAEVTPEAILTAQKVLSSRDPRCVATGKFIRDDVTETELLNDISYVMENFISETKFYEKGEPDVTAARILLIDALVHDRLRESYASLMRRVKTLLELLEQQPEEIIVCISHGFFLKLMEVYIKHPEIETNPALFLQYYDGSEETFKFCEGFIASFNGERKQIDSYIKKQK